jgi:hypothetical protein
MVRACFPRILAGVAVRNPAAAIVAKSGTIRQLKDDGTQIHCRTVIDFFCRTRFHGFISGFSEPLFKAQEWSAVGIHQLLPRFKKSICTYRDRGEEEQGGF